ncbi:MAG TPA: carboxypeptidase-like regulatory domain-containing protein [Planctomycetota bacterium]|nr:carboxypeptidase-like regulatory domain-containing protein [Planctomycetota bacterium]
MLRPFAVAFAACCAAGPAAGAPPPQNQDALVLMLREPSGGPATKATGYLVCEPAWELPVLRGLSHSERTISPTKLATGNSDEKGILRFLFHGNDQGARAGSGFVFTAQGLGALVGRLRPGQAQRLVLQPMAAVTTATGTEQFTLWARATLPAGETVTLQPSTGTEHRLPAGTYEVWAQNSDGWIWQRLDLVSGQRSVLQFTGKAQLVHSPNTSHIHPSGQPEIELRGPDGRFVLLGSAVSAPLTATFAFSDARVLTGQVLPSPPTPGPLGWPPASPEPRGSQPVATAFEFPDPNEKSSYATLFGLECREGGRWHVLGATAPSRGRFLMPAPPDGDTWLLLVVDGHAPRAWPWSQTKPVALELQRGVPLFVTARDARGDPIVDLQVEYVPEGQEVAAVAAHSDGRGRAELGRALAPGSLRISDARFANQDIALDAIPTDGVRVTVTEGSRVTGTASWPDGKPAALVLVTLRDPRGLLRPDSRTALTGPDGTFTFRGLPEEGDFVLFLTMLREGRTWSGRLASVRAGADPVCVTLRDEDPRLGPPNER